MKMIELSKGFEMKIPDDLTIQGRIDQSDFCVFDRIPMRRFLINSPEIKAEIDVVTRDLILALTVTIGIYTPEFEDGGGI